MREKGDWKVNMTFIEFFQLINTQLIPKINRHSGLGVFARNRSKFEGWLKVELIDCLTQQFADVEPEKNRVDITFDDWAVELKTLNTNFRYPNVRNRTRPITKNVQSVINDVAKLNRLNTPNKAVVFIAFPVQHNHLDWQPHLRRISDSLTELRYTEFFFDGDVPGVIYCGHVWRTPDFT